MGIRILVLLDDQLGLGEEHGPPGVVWNPALALHSLKKLKTIARLVRGRIFPGHDPVFWKTVKQAPDAYR